MNATRIRFTSLVGATQRILSAAPACILAALLLLSATNSFAATTGIVPFGGSPGVIGFETSEGYTTMFDGDGKLEGQVPATFNGTWLRSPERPDGAIESAGFIQTSVVKTGDQAVQIDRIAGSDDRWGVPVDGFPSERFVCIEWDMRVDPSSGTVGSDFGPLFGIEAYDDDAAQIGLLGTIMVDATTSDVLYRAQGGLFVDSGLTVALGDWDSYRIVLDYQEKEYSYFLNDTLLGTEGFVDELLVAGGLAQFTDADITAISGGLGFEDLTATAYFDNFSVFQTDINKIPEPSTLLIAGFGLGLLAMRRKTV